MMRPTHRLRRWWPLLLLCAVASMAQATDDQLAAQYMQQGDFERAALYYGKLYKQQPSAFNYDQLLRCHLALKQYADALELAKEMARRQGDPRYLVDQGAVQKLAGQPEKGEQLFDKAMKGLKEDVNSVRGLASAFQKYNELDRALETYERGRRSVKADPNAFLFDLAQLYAAKGDVQAMVNAYLDLVTANPSYLQSVQNGLARSLELTRRDARTDLLRTELLRRSQRTPDNTLLPEMLIWLSLQQKDLTSAFVQAKAMDKRFSEGGQRLMELAEIAVTNKEWEMARKCFQYILDLGKAGANYIAARLGLVRALDARITEQAEPPATELAELEAQYQLALGELGPGPNTTELLRGLARLKAYYLNDRVGAIDLLNGAIATAGVDPRTVAQLKLDLGDIHVLDGDIWEASLLYSQVDLDYKNDVLGHEARLRNAKVSFYAGDFLWAKAQLDVLKQSTSKLIANDAMELSLLITDNLGNDTLNSPLKPFADAQLLTYQHRYNEALEVLDSLNIAFPLNSLGDDILYERFRIAHARHQYDTAATFLQKLLELHPTEILVDNALLDLGRLYEEKLNDPEKAKGYYEKLLFEQGGSIFVPEARERFRHLRGDHADPQTPEEKFLNGPQ
jgi:tetratricopeptide (TPR) repeat protein